MLLVNLGTRFYSDSGKTALQGSDLVIFARTDAAACISIDEAIARAQIFHSLGAELTFVEAPTSIDDMRRICIEVPGPHLANMLERGKTPVLPPKELGELGFRVAAYPLTLISAAVKAMEDALELLKKGEDVQPLLKDFPDLMTIVGFDDYYELEKRYKI
mmetsp:Transcript_816/g.2358  ORF Transcript_816/g.2358 Transcript_816/m.2358 type:complete len:160 (-) Transcript_816:1978-2457(-)